MRTLHDLYVEEHGDEMAMGQLAVLGEARHAVARALRDHPVQLELATAAIDSCAEAIIDDCDEEE